MTHLSPETVEFLNCLYRSSKGVEVNLADALMLYRESLGKAKERFLVMEQVTVSEEEKTLFSNARFLLDKREELLKDLKESKFDTARFSDITKTEFDLQAALNEVRSAREKAHFSPIAQINGFLLVAWAHLHQEGPFEVVNDYFPVMSRFLGALEKDFKSSIPYLNEEVVGGFSFGFAAASEAQKEIEQFLATRDKDALGNACYKLKEGAQILNHYIDWQKQKVDKLWQQFSRFSIPVIGPDLQILLEDGKEGRTDNWAHKVELVEVASMKELLEFWNDAGPHLFINHSRKQELLDAIDNALIRTQKSLLALRELTTDSLKDYEDALVELSGLFASLEGETIKWPALIGTGGELLGETVKGIYYGSLPDFTIEEIIKYLRSSPFMSYQEEAVAFFESYLQEWDKEYLLQGLEKLLVSMPQKEEIKEEAASSIPCTFCGTANEPARTFCSKCNARLMLKKAVWYEEKAAKEPEASPSIVDLPLPLTAEPLVRLLRKVESQECSDDEAAALLNSLASMIRQTREQLRNDKAIDDAQREKMASILEEISSAASEATSFLASHDAAALRRALARISRASIEAKALEKE
jgi:hypothetical protein